MKIEWEYTVIIGIVTLLAIVGWQRGEISDINTLFSIGGAIMTVLVTIPFKIEIGKMNISRFMMQTALLNIMLGIVLLRGAAPQFLPTPYVIAVATATEEILRIGAYILMLKTFESPTFAAFVGGTVFAAMHMYWHPAEWLFAMAGGVLFTVMLMIFESQVACVASHFIYDMAAFRYIPLVPYFILSILMLIFAQIPIIKKAEI